MYWSFKDKLAVIDGVIMKGRHVIIHERLKAQALDQCHINHMGIEKSKLLVHKCIYWPNINNNIEDFIKKLYHMHYLSADQPKDKMIHHDIPVILWDVISTDMFTLDNKRYLCLVDYHSKFPIVKKTEDLSADSLILTCKIIFAEYRIP